MRNDISLSDYLPNYLNEYSEMNAALKAEEPEFVLLWNAADRVLENQFIDTADEYGISRFEKVMGIQPLIEDSIDVRRARVKSKWISLLPYTLKMLIQKLIILCGGEDFQVIKKYDRYIIRIVTHLRLYGDILRLRELLEEMIPANMVIDSFNSTAIRPDFGAAVYTGVSVFGKHKKIKREVNVYYGLE